MFIIMDSLKGTNLNQFRVWMTALWANQQFTGNVLKSAHRHSHYFLWYRGALLLAFTVYLSEILAFMYWQLLSYNNVPMVFIVVNLFPHEVSHQKLYFFFFFGIQKMISCSQFNCSTYLLFQTDGCYFANETCALQSDFHSSNQWMSMCSFPFFSENQHLRELSDIKHSAYVCQQQTNN